MSCHSFCRQRHAADGSLCRAIERIPLSRISQNQRTDARPVGPRPITTVSVNGSRDHGQLIRRTACWSYIVECEDPEETRTRPFSYFQKL